MFKAKLVPYNETYPYNVINNNAERSLHKKEDNFRFEHLGYYKLIDYGTYYYPVWKHYNRKKNVFCDRCHRQNLQAAIGYAQYDLCLLCVDELTNLNYDCQSRECHESKFLHDNSVDYISPDYVDRNKIWLNSNWDINPNRNIEPFNNANNTDKKKKVNAKPNIAITRGTYYYPAWKHYNKKTQVICNRCGKQNLRASIGYKNIDLCLICVDNATRLDAICPSRHCYEDVFINDSSNSTFKPSYVDLNSKKWEQYYKLPDGTHTAKIEKFLDMQNENEAFVHDRNFIITVIVIIILYFLIMHKTNN